ncbi:MAG: hypothetical protein ACE5JU_06215 [Candidatus Binatia bacterium]
MLNGVRAIDFMYYVATPEFIAKWNEAKKGELICRMERAIGGLPQYESIEAMIAKMNELGVEKGFITHVLDAMPSEHARPIYLDWIASDFPDLKMAGAHTGLPWVEELILVCYKWDNICFGVDAG